MKLNIKTELEDTILTIYFIVSLYYTIPHIALWFIKLVVSVFHFFWFFPENWQLVVEFFTL